MVEGYNFKRDIAARTSYQSLDVHLELLDDRKRKLKPRKWHTMVSATKKTYRINYVGSRGGFRAGIWRGISDSFYCLFRVKSVLTLLFAIGNIDVGGYGLLYPPLFGSQLF